MNESRIDLLKERADKIRPDLAKARETIEKAEAEGRELTPEEKAFTEPTIKTAREIADGMAKVREVDALMSTIRSEFVDVLGPLGELRPTRPSLADSASRASGPKSPP